MSLTLLSKSKFITSAFKNVYVTTAKYSSKNISPTETKTPDVPPPPPVEESYVDLLKKVHKPNKLEQKILVWTGRYKNAAEVPSEVSHSTMEKARNKARIKLANYMMAATVVGCVIMVISGKRAAERGETISKINRDWHAEMNKQPR